LAEQLHFVRSQFSGFDVHGIKRLYVSLAADGLDVAVNDIPTKLDGLKQLAREIEAIGRKAITIPGDVSKEAEVQGMVKQAVEELGGLDVVCFWVRDTAGLAKSTQDGSQRRHHGQTRVCS
jgi:NAD(P)-dependent dehydrogenase (short-subunit alcohol dehydrogenase family)